MYIFTFLSVVSFSVLHVSGILFNGVSLAEEPDANAFADKIVEALKLYLAENVEPFKLQDVSLQFWYDDEEGNHPNRVNVSNGFIYNISTLTRAGNATLDYQGNIVDLLFNAELSEISGTFDVWLNTTSQYNGKLNFQRFKQNINIWVLFVIIDPFGARVNDFYITDGPVEMQTSGLEAVLPVIMDQLAMVFRNFILPNIGVQIESRVRDIVSGDNKLPMPPPGPVTTTTEESTTAPPKNN